MGCTVSQDVKDEYEGQRGKHGMRHGMGTLRYRNGNVYKGQFNQNNIHGFGVMTWNNGNIYEGMWNLNVREGKGIFTSNAGHVYEGECKADMANGQGQMVYANGDVYQGQWVDDVREGPGKMIFKETGSTYEVRILSCLNHYHHHHSPPSFYGILTSSFQSLIILPFRAPSPMTSNMDSASSSQG